MSKRRPTPAEKISIRRNHSAHWKAFHALQKKVNKAWAALRTNVKKRAPRSKLAESRNELMVLLGECNYLAKEYKKTAIQGKRMGLTALKPQ